MPEKIDPDASPGSKLLKLFLILIADDKEHYQKELASRLNCSAQTVIRLCREVEGVLGTKFQSGLKNGQKYYRLIPDNAMKNLIGMHSQDLRYLNVCRALVDEYMPDQVKASLDKFLIELSLSRQDLSNPFTSEAGRGHFSFYSKGYIDYTPHFETIQLILDAIDSHEILTVAYKAAGRSQVRHHLFAPIRIFSMSGALYAFGAISADEYRVRHYSYLSIHRIKSADRSGLIREFPIPVSNLKLFGLKWHEPVTYQIRFEDPHAIDYVKERIFAENQQIIDNPDGSIFLKITTCSSPELFSFVRSFGCKARLFNEAGEEIDPLTETLIEK